LGSRFDRTGSIADLEHAVNIVDAAVAATCDHPDRAVVLSVLEHLLGSRFKHTGSMADLDRAIVVANEAVTATPQDHPDRPGRLSKVRP
jgi:hypothetical protein